MKVGLFVAFAGRNCGGPEVFECEVIRSLVQIEPRNEYHLYCLDGRAPEVIGVQADNVIYHVLQPANRVVSMFTSLPLAVARTQPDVFHGMVIPPPIIPRNLVCMLACSSLFYHPTFFPLPQRLRLKFLLYRAMPRSARVICVSKHVQDAMLDKFDIAQSRLPVIYPGVNKLFRPLPEEEKRKFVRERYGIDHPYFLFSGRWEQRKNVARTLQAFAKFNERSKTGHKLVLSGQRTWASREADQVISQLRLQNAIVDLGKTHVDELPFLYGAADAVLYASLWEGFGLPIVEGMACGTPVITSNLAAMPETAGGAALLVDPHSTESIAEGMQQIAGDSTLRARLSARGLKRASSFTWENTVRKTLDVYEEVVGGTRRYSYAEQV